MIRFFSIKIGKDKGFKAAALSWHSALHRFWVSDPSLSGKSRNARTWKHYFLCWFQGFCVLGYEVLGEFNAETTEYCKYFYDIFKS